MLGKDIGLNHRDLIRIMSKSLEILKQNMRRPIITLIDNTLVFCLFKLNLDVSICSIIEHLLPVVRNYKSIETFIQRSRMPSVSNFGLVAQALGAALSEILQVPCTFLLHLPGL